MNVDANELFDRLRLPDCDGCGSLVPLVQGGAPLQVDSGWVLDLGGHYGGFNDSCWMDGEPDCWVVLCHDCCVKVMAVLPVLAERWKGRKLHPYEGDTPCCEWGWQ